MSISGAQQALKQYNPPGSNPLPEWKQWPDGSWGYAPNPGPAAGSNNPLPGTSGVNAPLADIEAAQAANYAKQQGAAAPAPSAPKPAAPKTAKPAAKPVPKPVPKPAPKPAAKPATPAAPAAPGVPAGPPSPYSQSAMDLLARQKIIELLNTPQDIDQAELDRSPEAAANRLAAQRAYERNRALLAERNAAEGFTGTGGAESGIMRLGQARGESEVAFMGGLAGDKLKANRARLEQGIQFALSQGQFAAAEAMKEKLANLDAAVRREQIRATSATASADRALQKQLGLLDLGYRYDALGVNANKDAALAMMNPNFY